MKKALLCCGSIVALSGATFAQETLIDEITVTARKRDENLLDIPVAVTALTSTQLKNADIRSVQDLSDFVPGFQFENTTGSAGRANSPDIRFRGIRQQNAVPTQQVGAIFWDGSYIGAGAGIIPFGDLERVEVIKGPQTAYFGRNTFSGAVNFIPALPGDELEGNAEVSYSPSRDDGYSISGAVGGPVTETFGARVHVSHERDGGDFKYGDGVPHGRNDNTGITGVFTLTPTDSLRLKVSTYYVDGDGTYSGVSVPFTVPAGQCNRTFSGELVNVVTGARTPFTRDFRTLTIGTFCGTIPRGSNILIPSARTPTVAMTVGGATALTGLTVKNPLLEKYGTMPKMPGGFGTTYRARRTQFGGEYDLPAEHTLNVIASQAFTGINDAFDLNFGSGSRPGGDRLVNPAGNHVYMRENYYEARIASPQDQRLRYLIGVSDYGQRYRNGASGNRLTVNFENNKTFSVFGSVDYDFSDQFTLSVEGRYLDEKSLVIVNGNPNVFNPAVVTRNELSSFDDVIPRVILTYKPTDASTVYASFSQSSLIGVQTNARRVSELDPITVPDPAVIGDFTPPQQNTALELGWKQQFESWAFAFAGYHMDWKNQVLRTVVQAGNMTTSFGLPGDSEYLGAELELFASPFEWLDVGGGITFTDAELTNYASRGSFEQAELNSGILSVVADGNRPALVPMWSGSFNATFKSELGGLAWFLRGDVLWEGSSYFDNLEYNKNKGAARVNLRLGVDVREGTRIETFVTNVTNNKRLPSGSTTNGFGGRATFGPPYEKRRVGVRVRADF